MSTNYFSNRLKEREWERLKALLSNNGFDFVIENVRRHWLLMLKCNKVSAQHRASQKVHPDWLTELYDAQLMSEENFGSKIPPSWVEEIKESYKKEEIATVLYNAMKKIGTCECDAISCCPSDYEIATAALEEVEAIKNG